VPQSLPLIARLTRKARLVGLKSWQFETRHARTSFFVFLGRGAFCLSPRGVRLPAPAAGAAAARARWHRTVGQRGA